MKKIKICAMTTKSNTIQAFMLESLIDMSEKGFEVTIITDIQEGFLELVPENIKCIDIKMERKADLFGGIKIVNKLIKIFKNKKFDMIQYSTPNASFYASIASYYARIPKRLYLQWGIRYVGFSGIKRFIFKAVERLTCNLSSEVRAASVKNMKFAVNEKLYKIDKAKVIGDGGTIGVSIEKYDTYLNQESINKIRRDLDLSNSFVFGFVGSIRGDKGVTELLSAFKVINNLNLDSKLIIMGREFAGDPVDNDLIKWAKSCPNIIFTGYVNNVPKYLSAINVLVHPSYREGFSMVIQEAHALEKPVITTNIPGPSEVIKENETGLLVEPKSSEDLLEKMMYAYENQEELLAMGGAGRLRVEELFNRKRMLELTYQDRLDFLKERKNI